MWEHATVNDTRDTALHVVLVHPEIPWNTGNAGRTCLALGARLHLVRPLGFALTAKQLRRAGLDYWDRVAPAVWQDLAEIEAALPQLGQPYLFSAEAERSLWEVRFPPRVVLLFGRESVGLPDELRRRPRERLVRIPMRPGAPRSLNLSSCVAIAVAEADRQHRAAYS